MAEPAPRRVAVFVDFDNVLSGLREGAGVEVARRFAEAPEEWLAWLLEGAPRRAIIRRCYMNPQGYLEDAEGRTYFGGFRRAFMAAGFEVVDCPPLTRFKNGADLRIALDCLDALPGPTDEFTLLSTDSDFVPLLLRLRAADRATRLVAHPDLGRVVRAAADEVIGLDALAAALGWRPEGGADEMFGHDAREAVLAAVREVMAEADAPVHLPALGKAVLERTGQSLRGTDYAGLGSIEALLEAAGGFLRQPGEGGGYALRPEWRAPAPESSSE
ncbi:MAG: NYN domain-containing protein [Rubritepida sp.]|jgi:hypothetical protein|nr:NYN domain-containing protein [Rubritepida sp.]